jgi:hypothetical protein
MSESPKSEIRGPKELRNPRSEIRAVAMFKRLSACELRTADFM